MPFQLRARRHNPRSRALSYVSEVRLHQKANTPHPCWPRSSCLTVVRGDGGGPDHQMVHSGSRGRRRCRGCCGVVRVCLRPRAGTRRGGLDGPPGPLTLDGLIYASSMVMLDSARRKASVPALAWWLLGLGIAATLAANATHGLGHGLTGAAVAAWPSPGPGHRREIISPGCSTAPPL